MYRLALLIVAAALTLTAATLEKLSMDKMIAQSTGIVRGKIIGVSSGFRGTAGRGGMIYTHYTVKVQERLKGTAGSTVEVSVPGGTAQGFRQVFAGSPALNTGEEYVFFLWTSRSGLTQIMGLTQGLFTTTQESGGIQMLSRGASSEPMIDPATGAPVADSGVRLSLSELRQRIAGAHVE